jgi:hypothetical protein
MARSLILLYNASYLSHNSYTEFYQTLQRQYCINIRTLKRIYCTVNYKHKAFGVISVQYFYKILKCIFIKELKNNKYSDVKNRHMIMK